MDPINQLAHLAVVVSMVREADDTFPEPRIEIIDTRIASEIISLTPSEADAFVAAIRVKLVPYVGVSGD